MDFSFYSQAAPEIAISPEDRADNQCGNLMRTIDDDFDIGDLPVKLELRYAIEAKRAEKGLDMPVMDDMPRRPRELTIEEEERRKVRRERNKVAASRCRVKRKHHVRKLLKESDELTKSNNELENIIDKLQYEKNRLEDAIRTHLCKHASSMSISTEMRRGGS